MLIGVATPIASASSVTFAEFPLFASTNPGGIAAGSDGNVWFTSHFPDRVGRITPSGVVTEYPLPSPFEQPWGITAGPDGAVWFTEIGGAPQTDTAGIGRIDPSSGTITEFAQPGSHPYGITTGSDGNLWFTDILSFRISRMIPSGTVTPFPAAPQNKPLNIIAGPDGALWFTEDGIVEGGSGAIGRITTSGSLSEYILPTPAGHFSGAGDIAVGADGNLWFTWVTWDAAETAGAASSSVGRITPSGTITEFPLSSTNGWPPGGITSGPDGALWFTEVVPNAIGRLSTTGSLTAYPVPSAAALPTDVTTGPDGNLWFSEGGWNKIGKIVLSAVPTPMITSFSPGSGPVGTSVTILGVNFVGASAVTFSGVAQPSFAVDVTGTVITAAVPPGAGTGLIQVTTPYGTATSLGSFTVTTAGAHERNVTLLLRRHLVARVNVVVTDGYAACLPNMHVRIQRRISDRWRTIATDQTDANGSFIHRIPDRTGWYRAKVKDVTLANGDVCNGATSGTRHHLRRD
jgi:virginiamycin B lyase